VNLWDYSGLPYRSNGRDSKEQIRQEIKSDSAIFLIAETNGMVIGVVFGTHDGRKGWINRLAVREDFRNCGIGRMLVDEVERRFESIGINVYACLIESENPVSSKVFAKYGYSYNVGIGYFSKRRSPES
ncbi:MAG: GNAT family N-acetyltransferase, partial [candidate division Zixibacteria bacterium]|nr:GNAT family N-acetyltransferase [candidate division Zixibacteria bacterium]